MKAILTACAASICLGLTAAEVEWFDAEINTYTNFPSSGETFVVDGAGTWTNITDGVTLTNKRINLNNDATVDFELAKKRDVTATTTNTIIIVAENIPLASSLPAIADGIKGGIIPACVDENNAAYYGIVKDGTTNTWIELTGVTPGNNDTIESATFRIDYSHNGDVAKVRYSVGETVLKYDDNEWLDVVCDTCQIGNVSFAGNGDIAALKGNVSTNFSTNATVEQAIVALVNTNKLYGTWLLKMAEGENAASVQEALNKGVSQDALRSCLLANVVPTEDDVELEIPSIGFDANGNIIIGSSKLTVGGTDQEEHTINGTIRIYRATSIAELSTAQGESLGHTVPVPQQELQPSNTANAEFFQLRIEP